MTSSRRLWRGLGIALGAIALVALRFTAASPSGASSRVTTRAQLRISFSARPERIERCTELSDAELEKLPAHMRLRTTCEGFAARYALAVSVNGISLTTDTLRGGGLRHDRPLHVFRERELNQGPQRLRIEVTRIDEGSAPRKEEREEREQHADVPDSLLGGRADRERDERARRVAEAMPPRLSLDTLITIPSQRVVLVTFDNATRRLVARMEP